MLISDAALSRRLKIMRHELDTGGLAYNIELLQERDPVCDDGRAAIAPGQNDAEGPPPTNCEQH